MRALIMIIALLTVLAGQAKDITGDEAKRIASEFRGKLTGYIATRATTATTQCKVTPIDSDGRTMAYVCNYGDNDGFVVVAGDDCVCPVLGYADSGSVDCGNLPENMREWLTTMAAEIDMIKSGRGVAIRTASEAAEGDVVVDALVKTQWSQISPYNDLCPTGKLTGCVATAMAQIMNYHKWPEQGVGSNTYYCEACTKELSADFSKSKYDWDNMLTTYADSLWNEAQASAVALLMYDCGVSVNMDYGLFTSGSFIADACYAGNTYFKYLTAMYYHGNYSTEEFESMMKKELDNSRPLLFTGFKYAYTGGGHAFVVDGYRSDGKFHVNWGWNGKGDGFYELCLMNPNEGEAYPARQFIGTFVPNKDNVDDRFYRPLCTRNGGLLLDSDFDGDKGSAFTVDIKRLYCEALHEYKGQVGLGLFGEDGSLVKELAWNEAQEFSRSAYQDVTVAVESGAMTDISDGKYSIKALSKETIGEEVSPAQEVIAYGSGRKLDVAISGSNMKISNVQTPIDIELVSLNIPDKVTLFTMDSVQISLKNNADAPVVARPCIDFKAATGDNVYCVRDSTFVLYDGQQLALNTRIGFNLAMLQSGDAFAKAYLLDSNNDTIHVDGLGEWMPISVVLDETKVPRLSVSKVEVAEMVYDPEMEYYEHVECDPANVEVERGKEFEMSINVYYSFIGDVLQDTKIRFSKKETMVYVKSLTSSSCSFYADVTFDEIGEYDIPIEYQNVATGEWKTVEGSPTSVHFKVVEASGIKAVEVDADGEAKVYDINGRKSSKASKGLKIVVLPSGKVTKKVVR